MNKENEEFEKEIQAYNRGDRVVKERVNSPWLADSGDADSVSTGDVGSAGTAVGGNTMPLMGESQQSDQQDPRAETPTDSATQEHSISVSERSDSNLSFEEQQRRTGNDETFMATNDYALQEKLNEYINILLVTMQQCSGDDYRLLKKYVYTY